MIINFEKKESKELYEDKLDPCEFFSCDAIGELQVSDSDLMVKMKKALAIKDESKISSYTKEICSQIFERKFLKPLWKTIFEYNKFLGSYISDDGIRENLKEKMVNEDYAYRRYIAVKIIEECKLEPGQIFIVPRSNKFYSLDAQNVFHVFLDGGDKEIGKLLPQKDFSKLYENVAFYVFGKEDRLEDIKQAFIKVTNEKIPDKSELVDKATTLEWSEKET